MKAALFVVVILSVLACIAAQLTGSVSGNPGGGRDGNIALGKMFGNEKANIAGGVFASGNSLRSPATIGAVLEANKNGHGISLEYSKTPGFGKEFSQNGRVNILNDKTHKIDANVFHSRTNLENGLKFDNVGTSVNYNHVAGHGASLTASRIPQFDRNTIGLTGKANLWSSSNRQSSLDLTGSASRSFGGGIPAKNNFGLEIGVRHKFG